MGRENAWAIPKPWGTANPRRCRQSVNVAKHKGGLRDPCSRPDRTLREIVDAGERQAWEMMLHGTQGRTGAATDLAKRAHGREMSAERPADQSVPGGEPEQPVFRRG